MIRPPLQRQPAAPRKPVRVMLEAGSLAGVSSLDLEMGAVGNDVPFRKGDGVCVRSRLALFLGWLQWGLPHLIFHALAPWLRPREAAGLLNVAGWVISAYFGPCRVLRFKYVSCVGVDFTGILVYSEPRNAVASNICWGETRIVLIFIHP